MRGGFGARTKEMMAKLAGYRCSNPDCRLPTSGPQDDPAKAVGAGADPGLGAIAFQVLTRPYSEASISTSSRGVTMRVPSCVPRSSRSRSPLTM